MGRTWTSSNSQISFQCTRALSVMGLRLEVHRISTGRAETVDCRRGTRKDDNPERAAGSTLACEVHFEEGRKGG